MGGDQWDKRGSMRPREWPPIRPPGAQLLDPTASGADVTLVSSLLVLCARPVKCQTLERARRSRLLASVVTATATAKRKSHAFSYQPVEHFFCFSFQHICVCLCILFTLRAVEENEKVIAFRCTCIHSIA